MTKVKVIAHEVNINYPKFKDLNKGQYFRIDFTGENGDIYIKLPSVYSYETNQCGAWQYTYNAYSITSNKLCNINIEKECELIEKVEIHV